MPWPFYVAGSMLPVHPLSPSPLPLLPHPFPTPNMGCCWLPKFTKKLFLKLHIAQFILPRYHLNEHSVLFSNLLVSSLFYSLTLNTRHVSQSVAIAGSATCCAYSACRVSPRWLVHCWQSFGGFHCM